MEEKDTIKPTSATSSDIAEQQKTKQIPAAVLGLGSGWAEVEPKDSESV